MFKTMKSVSLLHSWNIYIQEGGKNSPIGNCHGNCQSYQYCGYFDWTANNYDVAVTLVVTLDIVTMVRTTSEMSLTVNTMWTHTDQCDMKAAEGQGSDVKVTGQFNIMWPTAKTNSSSSCLNMWGISSTIDFWTEWNWLLAVIAVLFSWDWNVILLKVERLIENGLKVG